METQNKLFTKKIGEVEYTAQFHGLRTALEAERIYINERTGRPDKIKLYDYVLSNVIVSPPGLEIESFEDLDLLDEVAAFGVQVLRNKFRPENETATKKRSGK